MPELTDEEVFGNAELSDEQVFGAPPKPEDTVKLSPYERADIANMDAGRGKAETGMESGTEFTAATRGAPLLAWTGLAAQAIGEKLLEPVAHEIGQHIFINPPDFGESVIPEELLPLAKEKGAIPALTRQLQGMTTEGGIATLPFAEFKPIQAYYAASIAGGLPDAVQNFAQAKTPEEQRDAATELALQLGFAGLIAAHGEKPTRAQEQARALDATIAPEKIPVQWRELQTTEPAKTAETPPPTSEAPAEQTPPEPKSNVKELPAPAETSKPPEIEGLDNWPDTDSPEHKAKVQQVADAAAAIERKYLNGWTVDELVNDQSVSESTLKRVATTLGAVPKKLKNPPNGRLTLGIYLKELVAQAEHYNSDPAEFSPRPLPVKGEAPTAEKQETQGRAEALRDKLLAASSTDELLKLMADNNEFLGQLEPRKATWLREAVDIRGKELEKAEAKAPKQGKRQPKQAEETKQPEPPPRTREESIAQGNKFEVRERGSNPAIQFYHFKTRAEAEAVRVELQAAEDARKKPKGGRGIQWEVQPLTAEQAKAPAAKGGDVTDRQQSAGPSAEGKENVAGPTRVAKGLRARKIFDAETAIQGPDILSWISENMPLASKTAARAAKGKEWWKENQSLYDDAAPLQRPHHNIIYGGKSMPDQVAQAAYEARVLKSPDVPELWRAIREASNRRAKTFATARSQEAAIKNEIAQHQDWLKATAEGEQRIVADDLVVGDTFDVDGERFKVTAKDPQTGTVTLEDGKRFGVQRLESGESIYVEDYSPEPPGESDWEPEPPQKPKGAELFGADETPFNLTGEKVKTGEPNQFVEPSDTQTSYGQETLSQNDLFAIEKLTEAKDPFKSADAAEQLYGGPAEAARVLTRQLETLDTNADFKKQFGKEQRARLKEVLNVLRQRAIIAPARPSLLEFAKSKLPKAAADKITTESQVESFRAQWEKEYPQATRGTKASPMARAAGGELGEGAKLAPEDDPRHSVFDAVPMELPEAVQVIKLLTGQFPKVSERLRALGGRAAGVFQFSEGPTGKGRIALRSDIFDLLSRKEKERLLREAEDYARAVAEPGDNLHKIAEERFAHLLDEAYEKAKTQNPVWALKVAWHEIGHLVDWLPDKFISGRGNIFGRIATLKKYLKHVLPLDPTKPAGEALTRADKAKLEKQALDQLREEMGPIKEIVSKIIVEEPEFQIVGLKPEDVLNILREGAGKDTPELTRWFAEQDSKVKAEILRKAMRGMLDERLQALGKKVQTGTRKVEKTLREKVGREPTPEEIKTRFAELLAKEIKARNLADLATIKAELEPLIAWWRGTKTMESYFRPSDEMYAEAFSVFANNPAALEKRAPTYAKLMWNYLDRKPEVRKLYDSIQADIKAGRIMPKRVRGLYEMWAQDDAKSLARHKETLRARWDDFYDNVRYHFDRRFGPVYARAKGYAGEGNVREAIASVLYRATEHERFLAELNNYVGKWLVKHNLDWSHDLGEYLFHKRIVNERFNIANPLGWTSKNSLERLKEMETALGPERWGALETAAKDFHAAQQKFVIDPAVQSGMFTPELNELLQKNLDYATFSAIKDLPDHGIERALALRYGPNVTPQIYRQIGNLGEIKNPATATVLKGLSLISAAYRNTMKREIVRMLQEQDPGNIMPAKLRWNGKFREPIMEDTPSVGTVVYMQDGKPHAFYVRKVMAEAMNQSNPTENLILRALVKVTGWQKGLFTQLNYAFWPVNFVRDVMGAAMQLPGGMSLTFAKEFPRALRAARDSVTHKRYNADADAALRRKLVISQADPRGVWAAAENEYELKLASYGMDPAAWSREADKVHGIVKLWNFYRELGQTGERVTKIAGMLYLDKKFPNMPEWKKREIIRERSGSPNFLERGASNPAVDLFILFYNPWKEGVRSVIKSARENPFSFAAKATALVLAPTILQAAAFNGWLGEDTKKRYRAVPDYYLSNYLLPWVGWADQKQGKVAAVKLPLWEPARIAHGALFRLLTGRGTGIAAHAGGQLPTLNPIWQVGLAWAEYAQGKNPQDLARGVNVLTDTEQQARGSAALAEMAKWTWNEMGGGIINRFKNLNLEGPPETDAEKFLDLPGINNALGRWVIVTDKGNEDEARMIAAPTIQQQAQLRLACQQIAAKLLQGQALTQSERMILRDPYAANYLEKELLPEMMKMQSSPLYRQLKVAPTKQGKAAVLKGTR